MALSYGECGGKLFTKLWMKTRDRVEGKILSRDILGKVNADYYE